MNDETHRFFRLTNRPTYEAMCAQIDADRGYPRERTLRGLTLWDDLFKIAASEDRLICIDRWRFHSEDDAMLQPALDAGAIIELSLAEYLDAISYETELPPETL